MQQRKLSRIRGRNWCAAAISRSMGRAIAPLAEPGNVLLLDSLGELASIYRLADAVFVGGSLVPSGGHNILEPAAFSKVPVYGPSMDNFREMAANFLEAGAAIQVKNSEDLGIGLDRFAQRSRIVLRAWEPPRGNWWNEIEARRRVFWTTSSRLFNASGGRM